jgi:hypothetical protein
VYLSYRLIYVNSCRLIFGNYFGGENCRGKRGELSGISGQLRLAVVATLAEIASRIRPDARLEFANCTFAKDGTRKNAGVSRTPAVKFADHFSAMSAGELDRPHRPRLPLDRLIFANAIQPHAVPTSAMNRPHVDQRPNLAALVANDHSSVAVIVPTMSIVASSRARPQTVDVDSSEKPNGVK